MSTDDPMFERSYLGTPVAPHPSPGPWKVKRTIIQHSTGGRATVFVVLDANDKCVAECDHEIDARHIADNGPNAERDGENPGGR